MLDGVRHASCALLRCQREEDARITELFMRPIEFCMRPLELFIAGFHLCLPPICSGLPNLQPSYRSQCPYRRGTKCGELAQHLHKDLSLALSLARSLSLSLSPSLPPSLPLKGAGRAATCRAAPCCCHSARGESDEMSQPVSLGAKRPSASSNEPIT